MMILALLFMAADGMVQAGPARRFRHNRIVLTAPRLAAKPAPVPVRQVSAVRPTESSATAEKSDDALAEVNAERSKRGLRAFVPDPLLNQAARTCARIRAAGSIDGHLPSDFAHLPSGASAASAGCGALEPSWGWGTCCTYDNYTYAGAAWVMGTDGKRYMHLFVR